MNTDATNQNSSTDGVKFKIETMGGDASLLHLASQLDRGI